MPRERLTMTRKKITKKSKSMISMRYLTSKRWPKLVLYLVFALGYLLKIVPGLVFGLAIGVILSTEFYIQPLLCAVKGIPNAYENYKKSQIISALSKTKWAIAVVILLLLGVFALGAILSWNQPYYYMGLLLAGTAFMFLSWYVEQITRDTRQKRNIKRIK